MSCHPLSSETLQCRHVPCSPEWGALFPRIWFIWVRLSPHTSCYRGFLLCNQVWHIFFSLLISFFLKPVSLSLILRFKDLTLPFRLFMCRLIESRIRSGSVRLPLSCSQNMSQLVYNHFWDLRSRFFCKIMSHKVNNKICFRICVNYSSDNLEHWSTLMCFDLSFSCILWVPALDRCWFSVTPQCPALHELARDLQTAASRHHPGHEADTVVSVCGHITCEVSMAPSAECYFTSVYTRSLNILGNPAHSRAGCTGRRCQHEMKSKPLLSWKLQKAVSCLFINTNRHTKCNKTKLHQQIFSPHTVSWWHYVPADPPKHK